MATKKPSKPEPEKKALGVTQGMKGRLKKKRSYPTFAPNETERVVIEYVERRVDEMIDFRSGLGIEQRWHEADEEYIPHELDFGTTRKRFETDQDTGLRSRMVPVGDITQQWRQASSAPTLLAKLQTALSILIDSEPEAELVPILKRFMGTTDLAYALWKRNWTITGAKDKLKLFVFNLAKYGWAVQRTYPRKVTYDKRIITEIDLENPENDKFKDTELTWFNDVDRQPLSVFHTWIDEQTKPYDQFSMNEGYFEIDYTHDQFLIEFGKYPNSKYVKPGMHMDRVTPMRKSNRTESNREEKKRQDLVTVGFFQSRTKDLYSVYIPSAKIVVYASPLPNDDGYLDLTHSLWVLRSDQLPYGVSLWEMIRQNKTLYDKMKNMTMDQLVLSIMKFGFFAGTNTLLGDGKIEIVPGEARQLTSSTGKPEINWMEIPGPGDEAWKGIEAIAAMMDDESGISPNLEGEVTGKTLGEIQLARAASLKRLKVPLDNIAWAIEQDAYLTLSWMSQLYSIPTVKEFVDDTEMMEYEKANKITHENLFQAQDTNGKGKGPLFAHYMPELALHLEDSEGKLVRGKESQFFQVGSGEGQIKPSDMKWRGIFKVIPRSIIDSNEDLVKASKSELANLLGPMFEQPPELYAKLARQMCKVNEEDEKDWLPDSWLQYLNKPNQKQQAPGIPGLGAGATGGAPGAGGPAQSIFIKPGQQVPGMNAPVAGGGTPPVPPGAAGNAPRPGLPTPPPYRPAKPLGAMPPPRFPQSAPIGPLPSLQSRTGLKPRKGNTIVPRHKVGPKLPKNYKGLFNRKP